MKDLEKIKSEDLAAQVQDANPGNFAIEQEVAALVGATVPAPTEPSADDARELPAQLLVFLRRALTPIQSALRTALADIYAHLDSRCTDYTPAAYDPFRLPAGPYDPMRPLTPRTLPNLLTAITAFSDRKISGVPEAADGVSLVHLLGGAYSDVTELTDDNRGWTIRTDLINTLKSIFPNLTKLSLGFKTAGSRIGSNLSTITELTFPGFELQTDGHLLEGNIGVEDLTIPVVQIKSTGNWTQSLLYNNSTTKILRLPNLKYMTNQIGYTGSGSSKILVYDCSGIEEIYAPQLEEFCSNPNGAGGIASGATNLKKVVVGDIRIWAVVSYRPHFFDCFRRTTYPNLLHLEFKSLSCSLDLSDWTATNVISHQDFLPNFKNHIALRLTSNGSGLTLTLSQAVRDAIHAAEATYGIEAIIVTQKGWTLSPAPSA